MKVQKSENREEILEWLGPLSPGDRVEVVAPGFGVPIPEVEAGLNQLRAWGLDPFFAPDSQMKRGDQFPRDLYFHAHTDERRWELLRGALENPSAKAIWCLRGGYGSNRLLPYLRGWLEERKAKGSQRFKKNQGGAGFLGEDLVPKLLIGMSDITSLHLFFLQFLGWPVLHGPMVDRLGSGKLKHQEELRSLVFGETNRLEYPLTPLNEKARGSLVLANEGSLVSRIWGGNLTVLVSSLGTPYQIQGKGQFLFLEDVGERGYRIDRMLEQLHQAGIFQSCRGVLLGTFRGGEEPSTGEYLASEALFRWAERDEVPVWSGLEVGHGDDQRALPFGVIAKIQKDRLIVDL